MLTKFRSIILTSILFSLPLAHGGVLGTSVAFSQGSEADAQIQRTFAGSTLLGHIRPPLNCEEYDQDAQACLKCMPGFYLQHGDCKSQDRVSPSSLRAASHLNSAQEAPKILEKRLLSSSISNCSSETTINGVAYCRSCNALYYLSANKKNCLGISDLNCLVNNLNENACAVCSNGYYLSGGICYAQAVNFCGQYNEANCAYCISGYYLNGNSCAPQNVSNCEDYTPNTNDCLSCVDGFFLSGSSCAPQSLSNCIQYNHNQNFCLSCAAGYYASSGVCAAQSITNCGKYTFNTNVCLECSQGYYLNNGACAPQTQARCSYFSHNSNVCLACEESYYINGSSCSQQSVNFCRDYDPNSNTCANCKQLYYKDNSGGCQSQSVSNCLVNASNSNTQCAICQNGFVLSSNACTAGTIANCYLYQENANACSTCHIGYYLSSNSCPAITISNCEVNIVNQNQCQICQAGYYPSNGLCVSQSIPNCQSYASNVSECTQCDNLYYVNASKTCSPITKTQCQQSNGRDDACTQCNSLYYISSGSCVALTVKYCASSNGVSNACGTCSCVSTKVSDTNCSLYSTFNIKFILNSVTKFFSAAAINASNANQNTRAVENNLVGPTPSTLLISFEQVTTPTVGLKIKSLTSISGSPFYYLGNNNSGATPKLLWSASGSAEVQVYDFTNIVLSGSDCQFKLTNVASNKSIRVSVSGVNYQISEDASTSSLLYFVR